jgi:PHD/YefM family antitoxin component YafN of YafNO toxin-antitoxin module
MVEKRKQERRSVEATRALLPPSLAARPMARPRCRTRLSFPPPHPTMSSSRSEGSRQNAHEKARAVMLSEFERQKADLKREAEKNARPAKERFTAKSESIEETLKKQTVGLVSAEDFKRRREELEEEKRRELGKGEAK